MIINHNGQKYFIENWDEFSFKLLNAIGAQVEVGINNEINRQRLVGKTAQLKGAYKYSVVKNNLIIDGVAMSDGKNPKNYAAYIEYGTFDYFAKYGLDKFPVPGYPSIPKKKDISRKAAKNLPKGMQPFAPIRRILYNQNKMAQIITKAVKSASR